MLPLVLILLNFSILFLLVFGKNEENLLVKYGLDAQIQKVFFLANFFFFSINILSLLSTSPFFIENNKDSKIAIDLLKKSMSSNSNANFGSNFPEI